ncbi:MAG TPA: sugar phosphate isomerase/epimerase family protein [Chloroflexota bacterium]|jgi:sugar phosphate isomerase/epimerase|nr:sugar phosphate isomerase/epimerase family protein [Chloroflexota bacterium]
MDVQLGAMNRPWTQFTFEEALAGIAGAGFKYFGFLAQQRQLLVNADTPPEEVDAVVAQVRRHGLEPRFIPSSVPLDRPLPEAVGYLRRLVDNARRAGVPVLLEMGHSRPERYETYFAVMRQAAPYAAEQGITIALKPHGGLSTTGDDCLQAIKAVDHPAYRLCFDPGNLLYYAGQRPEVELPKLAPYVVAMCIKDETGGSGPERSVNVTPGDGDVDFPAVFKILKDHGFEGKPAIVETLGGRTLEEVNHEARRAYAYLTEVLSRI